MPYNEKSRQNLSSWTKGKSGNPNGSSKLAQAKGELQRIADEHGHKPAGLFLEIMEDESQRIELRLKAATLLDDRMNGRPRQSLEVRDERTIEDVLSELPDPD